MLLILVSLCF